MNDRPRYTKWRRTAGGMKVCPSCGHRHKPVLRIEDKVVRPKTCVKCGSALPGRLEYPRKAAVQWFVREFDPATGETRDIAADSAEHADEMIRQLTRDWTQDPIQARLVEHASNLARGVTATDRDDAVNQLIVKLGGDPTARKLIPVSFWDAVHKIMADMACEGLSKDHLDGVRHVATRIEAICKVDRWADLTLEDLREYRRGRMAGGWKLDDKVQAKVGGAAVNGDLRNLSAFLSRAEACRYVARNILLGKAANDLWIKTRAKAVCYMPDAVLNAIIEAAEPSWFRAFIVLSYYVGARKPDLLALEWRRDVDLEGEIVDPFGLTGPKTWIDGNKADTPHWVPLHPAAEATLRSLKAEPVIDAKVFPVRQSICPATYISKLWRDACDRAKATLPENLRLTPTGDEWEWKLLRKKANTDYRRSGASPKERMAFLGHKTTDVNERHYEGLVADRMRQIVDAMPSFRVRAG